MIEYNLKSFDNKEVPRTVFVNRRKFPRYAAYDLINDVLFVSNQLNSKEAVAKLLEDNYFASKGMKDILTHELAHKKHWDAAKTLYKQNPKCYNSVEDAKQSLDADFIKYIKDQVAFDNNYLYKLSWYACDSYFDERYNEILAEVLVNKDFDANLSDVVRRMFGYDDVSK